MNSMQNVWDDGMKFQRALISQDLSEGVFSSGIGTALLHSKRGGLWGMGYAGH